MVSFRVPQAQVAAQARIISQSAGTDTPPPGADLQARQQVFAAYKSQLLGPAARPVPASQAAASTVITEAGESAAAAQPGSSVVVVQDYEHLPITKVSISSAAELARLRADPNVLSVEAIGIVRAASLDGWEHIGVPAVTASGYTGSGTVVIVDSGRLTRAEASVLLVCHNASTLMC